jgi:DNA-binding beta-propeller fold protein YncE
MNRKSLTATTTILCVFALALVAAAWHSKHSLSPFMTAAAAAAANPAPGPSGYHIVKRIPVKGDSFWDYLAYDAPTHRLFISHGTQVDVLDVASGKLVGAIPDTPGVHGVAFAPKLNRGFVSAGRAAKVVIFNLKTLATIGTVKTGDNPDAILYDPATRRIFTMNGRSHDSTAIDAATGRVAGTIPLPGKPEFAVADGHGNIFVNLEDKSQELRINSKTLKIVTQWPMAPCESPSGLAMDIKHQRLFAGCDNKLLAVMDAKAGRVVTTVPIGEGVDANRFDPGTQYVFSSNGQSGTLTVIHEDSPNKYTVVENVPTVLGARTMEIDPVTHDVFLVTAKFGPRPAATTENPHPRPALVPDSFVVLVLSR